MTALDFAIIGIILASLLLGAWRGVVGEIIALVAWILGFLAARPCGPEAARVFLSSLIADPVWRLVAGYILVFVGVLLLLALLRLAVRGLIRALGLGLADRLLGVVFGVARGALIVLLLFAAGGMTSLPKASWWAQAQLAPPFETAVLLARPWLPDEVAKRIKYR